MLFTEASTPRIISVQASAVARCSLSSSDIASWLLLWKLSSWRSYSALVPASALRALSSQRAAWAFHSSIWLFSFWTYSSRLIMDGLPAGRGGILEPMRLASFLVLAFSAGLALGQAYP
jgi:hypothetical protein